MSRRARLFGLIASACVLLFEGYLRTEPELPSLRASVVPFRPTGRPSVIAPVPDIPGCRGPEDDDKPLAWQRTFGEEAETPIRILVAGDSISMGDGVAPEESYAGLVGKELARTLGRTVEVVNAGVNAAGYCHVVRAVHQHLREGSFDHIVIGFFADDLEQRAVTLEGGLVRADPRMVGGIIGAVASRSYIINWLWLKVLESVVAIQTSDGRHPPRHVTRPGRKIPERSLQNFSASIKGLEANDPLFVLIPPVGAPLCPPAPEIGSECEWLNSDMEQMAERLKAFGPRFVDLRDVWSDGADHTQTIEQRWWREQQRLPVHPNPDGHRRIANTILSSEQIP